MKGSPGERDVLIVTDPQRDFCPGGGLAVPEGDQIMPVVNRLARRFAHVVVTQDWHPPGHMSFASAHPGHKPFETIEVDYGAQTLWPDHCVQGTPGAAFHPALDKARSSLARSMVRSRRWASAPIPISPSPSRHRCPGSSRTFSIR